jgi:ligand-binding sensor domain-containing protein/class 3 adenylate cyclase
MPLRASVSFSAVLLVVPLFAQQYGLRTFSIEEGLPSAAVHALCEDADGFLWVATDEGAARGAGLRFEAIGRRQGLKADDVTALYRDRADRIWLGSRNGAMAVWDHGVLTALAHETFPRARVRAIAGAPDGTIWWGTDGHGVVRYSKGRTQLLGLAHGLPGSVVNALIVDARGHLLVGTDGGLARLDGDRFRMVPGLPSSNVFSLFSDSIGVLVGTAEGYLELDHDLRPLPPERRFSGYFPLALPDARVLAIIRATNGDIWLGTPAGLVHFSRRSGHPELTVMGEANGLGHDLVRSVVQDRSGAIWAGTGFGGVSRFTSDALVHFTERDGLRSRIVSSMHRTPDGRMWIGTVGGGVARWDGRSIVSHGPESGLADPYVVCLGEDGSGDLLVGTATQGLFKLEGDRFKPYGASLGLRVGRVNAIRLDDHGRIVLATGAGVYRLSRTRAERVGPVVNTNAVVLAGDTVWTATERGLYRSDGAGGLERVDLLPQVVMTSMARDGAGNLWIGTEGHGLYRLKGRSVDSLGTGQGLTSHAVEQVLLDAYDNVWLGTRRGADHIELDPMQEHILALRHYGRDEGFIGIECFRNACYLDGDSALWFGTVRGATRFDPRRVLRDDREPLVHLTELRLFFEKPDWTPWCERVARGGFPEGLVLPYDQNHLTFAFTGVSLAYPERVRYRYILQGYDPDWSPITATDRITYSNIPPGEYTFKVMARNGSGVWNEEPVTYTFRIAPPFWSTMPFRAGVGIFFMLSLVGFIRLRESRLRRDRERLEDMVARRTRELATEKDRSERLLLNILPASTAEELKTKGSADARRYESVTVLFSDFTGFTGFSSLMDSTELVAELDRFFRLFDGLCAKHGLEKIKTIGDAYMCAAGVPEPAEDHAMRAVRMALGMREAVDGVNRERRAHGLPEWPIRIGMHSGPVVAGVVGEKKFAYDIWGDTVNLASRMESNSEPGRINISGSTYARVMDEVVATPRGPIKVKGKGELHMYFLEGLKPVAPLVGGGG